MQNISVLEDHYGLLLVSFSAPDVIDYSSFSKFIKEKMRLSNKDNCCFNSLVHLLFGRRIVKKCLANYKEALDLDINIENNFKLLTNDLRRKLSDISVLVEHANYFTEHSIEQSIRSLIKKGSRNICFLPVYPIYSNNTKIIIEKINEELTKLDLIPEYTVIPSFHESEVYISFIASEISNSWSKYGKTDKLIISFQGISKNTDCDAYSKRCIFVAYKIAEKLELAPHEWEISYWGMRRRKLSKFFSICKSNKHNTQTINSIEERLEAIAMDGRSVTISTPDVICDNINNIYNSRLHFKSVFNKFGGKKILIADSLNANSTDMIFDIIKKYCMF